MRACIVMDPVLAAADLFNTLEMLAKLARTSQQGPAMQLLVEQARRPKCASLLLYSPKPMWLCHVGCASCHQIVTLQSPPSLLPIAAPLSVCPEEKT